MIGTSYMTIEIASVLSLIKEFVSTISDKKRMESNSILRDRILRYFQDAQKNCNGSFSPTLNDLLSSNLFNNKKESAMASEILTELVKDGFLFYQSGSYYLKGHEPCF